MRVLRLLCGILVFALCGAAFADHATEDMGEELWSRWHDVDFEYSVSYEDYIASCARFDTEMRSVLSFPLPLEDGSESEGRVAILVNSSLYPLIEDDLITWVADINNDGFEALLVEATFETIEDLRAALRWAWESDESLVGCILVGDFPVPWYSILNEDGLCEAEFPCDMYYEDLDGDFTDTNDDGIFDSHVDGGGDAEPEIWIGRLLASPMSVDESELVVRYLRKNHLYRTGGLDAPHRALLFIDKDWVDLAPYWETALGRLYDDIKVITDYDKTNAEEYLRRLEDGYEWVDVMVHSGPDAHYFSYRDVHSMLYNWELQTASMNCLFYVPFSCSNSRYVEPDYMGGWYIFGENSLGLSVIGSTKSGSLYYGYEMFEGLSEGECIGEGFKSWFVKQAPYNDHDIGWFYGLTVLGDPTLRPPDTAPPKPPRRFRSEVNDEEDGIRLFWEPSDAGDLGGYRLYYDTEGEYPPFDGGGLPQGDSPIDMGFATSFTVRYEDMGQFVEVHWAVTAYDIRGNESDYSNPLDSGGDPVLNPPRISWVWTDQSSYVSYEDGGTLALMAYIEDDEDEPGSLDVELLLDGQQTGVMLYDDGAHGDYGAGDAFYSREIVVPAGALPKGKYLISFTAIDSNGNRSAEWPYLTIPQNEVTDDVDLSPMPPLRSRRGGISHAPDRGREDGPVIASSAIGYHDDSGSPYVSISMTVYHPVSPDNVVELEIYYNSQPTGIFFDRYPEYDNETEAYFWSWFYASEYGLGPGKYLIEAVATDEDGNESDMFPYLWVE